MKVVTLLMALALQGCVHPVMQLKPAGDDENSRLMQLLLLEMLRDRGVREDRIVRERVVVEQQREETPCKAGDVCALPPK